MSDRYSLITVNASIFFVALMLISWTPAIAREIQESQETDAAETAVSQEEEPAEAEEKVDTNDPTAAAWSYALGFEFYDWKEDIIAPGQTRPTGNDNTVQARIVAPLPAGTLGMPIKSLVRFTYRNIEAPGGTSATGNSELMWLTLPKDWGTGRFGIGPLVTLPGSTKVAKDEFGYGLAVAQAQHTVRELATLLEKNGVKVTYGVHPVAGRMPGHMNVLLAEADVPYDRLKDMDEVNPTFEQTDVTIVIGANDVVNPVARTDPQSPIAGMPIIDVDKARTVVVVKRSLSPGFAGIPNPLFAADNCLMMFGDGKKAMTELVTALKES